MKKCWCGNERFFEYSKYYWQCKNCKTLVSKVDISYDVDHIQDQCDFYGKNYWEKKMVAAAQRENMGQVIDLYLKERAVYWLKTLFRYVLPGKGTIAETGCGLGQFSYLVKLSGYQQIAYELSPEICRYIHDTLKLNIVCGGMKENTLAYDAIAAFDVLEHFIDPKEFLQLATKSLKDDGILLMQTPCYDYKLDYAHMLKEKPRFKEQLKQDEHVYLFSKDSLCALLEKCGFSYVTFLDAYFGNDYDMFFVASKKPIHVNTPEEIEENLNQQENGRLIKALFALWSEQRNSIGQLSALHEQQREHMDQINILTAQLQISETDRAERLKQINNLTERIKVLESEQSMKLKQMNTLSTQLRVSEEDRAARLEQINTLTMQLQTSEADRAARLDQINLLTEQLKKSEEDRAERLKQILSLTDAISKLQQHS